MIGVTEEGLNWNSAQYFIYLNFVLLWFERILFGVNCSLITSLKLASRCHILNPINKSTLYIVNLYHRITLKLSTFFSTDRRIRPPPCWADVPTKRNITAVNAVFWYVKNEQTKISIQCVWFYCEIFLKISYNCVSVSENQSLSLSYHFLRVHGQMCWFFLTL